MNKITTYIGAAQRPIVLILMFLIINPHSLDGLLSVTAAQYLMKIVAVVGAFIGFLKDYKTADAKTVTDLIQAVPVPAVSQTGVDKIRAMKAEVMKAAAIILCMGGSFFLLVGCAPSNLLVHKSDIIYDADGFGNRKTGKDIKIN